MSHNGESRQMESVGLLRDRVMQCFCNSVCDSDTVCANVYIQNYFLAPFTVELACRFLSSPQGSAGHNAHLHAVPSDAVLCLSVCGLDDVCERGKDSLLCVMAELMHFLALKWDVFPSRRLLCS